MTGDPRFPSSQRGMTLIEILIALVVGLFLIGGIVQLLVNSGQTYRMVDASSRVQENARFALGELSRSLRMAGFMGCSALDELRGFNIAAGNFDQNAYNVAGDPMAMIGYEGGADDAASAAAASNWTAFLATETDEISWVSGTDVVQVFYTWGDGAVLADDVEGEDDDLQLTANTDGLNDNQLAVLTDCAYASVFRVDGDVDEGDTTLPHEGIGRTYTYEAGARVFPVEAEAYFIGTNSEEDSPCFQRTCLYRLPLGGNDAPEDLVIGAEDLQIQYGWDGDGDGVIDDYRDAGEIDTRADWSKVYTARLGVLFASEEEVTSVEQAYVFADPDAAADPDTITAVDRRYREAYWITATLRNRLP
jgi:type IV pilus assembly protein PilW